MVDELEFHSEIDVRVSSSSRELINPGHSCDRSKYIVVRRGCVFVLTCPCNMCPPFHEGVLGETVGD